jgi:hypothetical protein
MTPQLARGIGPVLAQHLQAPRGCGLAWVWTEDARVAEADLTGRSFSKASRERALSSFRRPPR